jgi:AhpD family alkylhydroperoxidase
MVDETSEKRREELLRKMKEQRGYMLGPWEYMAEKDPDFMEAYNGIYSKGLSDGNALPIKTRELIAIAILAFRGRTDGVYEHMKRALRHGATKQELLEAAQTMLVPGGAPTFSAALKALMRIEQEDTQEMP